jgi:hypothetical protein
MKGTLCDASLITGFDDGKVEISYSVTTRLERMELLKWSGHLECVENKNCIDLLNYII